MTKRGLDGPPDMQAKTAILRLLVRIRDEPAIGWYLGYGTQTFSDLTEAAAALCGEPVEKVREMFLPRNPKNPMEE